MATQASGEGPCYGHKWQRYIIRWQNGHFSSASVANRACASGRRQTAGDRHGPSTQSHLHWLRELEVSPCVCVCMCVYFVCMYVCAHLCCVVWRVCLCVGVQGVNLLCL